MEAKTLDEAGWGNTRTIGSDGRTLFVEQEAILERISRGIREPDIAAMKPHDLTKH